MTSEEFTEQLDENLNKWFKEKWVRFGPDGKIRGDCARGSESEGKPKCLPKKKAQALGKKGRKYAGAKKRREDPNPERSGKAKNVATKKKTNEDIPFNECPECRGPIIHESMMNEKQDACYHKVKSRYKVWPSAYASGALVQCRKKGAKNWGTGGKKNESSIMKGLVDETAYEADLEDNEPRIVIGVYGMKSKEFRKKFANQKAQDRFFDHPDREGNFEIHYVQKADISEAKGTPGGIEMHRTPQMVNLAMQQNLYKKDLEAYKKQKRKETRKQYPAPPKLHLGAYSYPISAIEKWIDTKDVGEALTFAVNKFAHKQSNDFKSELIADPAFKKAVINFFKVAAATLEARNAAMAKSGGRLDTDYRTKKQTEAGFEVINRINDILLTYMKKYGVDKTGRRVPPGFNYSLGEGVIIGHDKDDPEVAVLGGAGSYKLSNLKKKAQMEADELAKDVAAGKFKNSAYNVKQLANTLNTIVAAEDEMEKSYFGEDFTGQFAAERTAETNPYGGMRDIQQRGALGEDIDEARQPHPLLKAANKNLAGLKTGEVQRRERENRRAETLQRQATKELERMLRPKKAAKSKKPTLDQIWQKVEHAISNYFPDGDPIDFLGPYMEKVGIDWDDITRAAKKNGYKDLWDYWDTLASDTEADMRSDWEYSGKKGPEPKIHRFGMNETPDTSGSVGTQPGGWRDTRESSIMRGLTR